MCIYSLPYLLHYYSNMTYDPIPGMFMNLITRKVGKQIIFGESSCKSAV